MNATAYTDCVSSAANGSRDTKCATRFNVFLGIARVRRHNLGYVAGGVADGYDDCSWCVR